MLGNWCLKNIEEEQSALLQGGIPCKQGFTLAFVRYGDDLQNYYGHLNRPVEVVLDANQGLAYEVQLFRTGLIIQLPDIWVPSDEVAMLRGYEVMLD